jgi:hypothetical protein
LTVDFDVKGVVLCGEPGSGKTTIGTAIADKLGWQRVSFAAGIKEELTRMLTSGPYAFRNRGLARQMRRSMDDPTTKDHVRPLLQALGEFRRQEDAAYWLRFVLRDIKRDGKYVNDDCRHNNEYEALRTLGFVFVRLESGETTRTLEGEQAAHVTEANWPTWDYDLVLHYTKGVDKQAAKIIKEFSLSST